MNGLRRRVWTLLCLGAAAGVRAQTEDLPPPPPGYNPIIPEKIEGELDKTEVKHDLINIKWGLAPIFDYTWFTQDAESLLQVGQQVAGGYMTKFFAGVNWWANRRIRLTAGYGRASLDKLGIKGHTNQFFTRAQWIY